MRKVVSIAEHLAARNYDSIQASLKALDGDEEFKKFATDIATYLNSQIDAAVNLRFKINLQSVNAALELEISHQVDQGIAELRAAHLKIVEDLVVKLIASELRLFQHERGGGI